MDVSEVIRTTFAAREFTDDPVSDEQLYQILDLARFAPSGGNRQGWRVIVVRDPAKRAAIVKEGLPIMKRYMAQATAGENPYNTVIPSKVTQADVDACEIPDWLIDCYTKAPVLLLILVDMRVVASFDADVDRVGIISGGSVYPFAWNILLAARNMGLGGALTTFAATDDKAVQKLFDLPSYLAPAAVMPLGKPVKQLTKLKRFPVEHFTTIDRIDGEPLKG